MKKIILSAVTALTLLSSGNVSAQVVEQGNMIFDVYYGFPNLYSTVFRAAYTNSGSEENIKIGGLGPVGIRGEYMLADKFGIGLDIGFNNTKLSFSEFDVVDNKTYDYNFTTQKIGAMVTFNYHFLDNDQVDLYGVFGVGYGNRSFKFESTDPLYDNSNVDAPIPVASRLGVGLRYFFTDNIGANIALGFGQGGLINAGLSVKI